MYATWIEKDQRFGFRLNEGAHKITEEERDSLLAAEAAGMQLAPAPLTGRPVVVPATGSADDPAKEIKKLHQRVTSEINRECEASITGGFWSNALGARHLYGSQQADQINLAGAVSLGQSVEYPCRDVWAVKAYVLHSAQQLRKVSDEFVLYKMQLLQRADELKQRADEALDKSDRLALQAIKWEPPAL